MCFLIKHYFLQNCKHFLKIHKNCAFPHPLFKLQNQLIFQDKKFSPKTKIPTCSRDAIILFSKTIKIQIAFPKIFKISRD